MEEKEIILAKISEIFGRADFIFKKNGDMKSRLRCCGLNSYYETYSEYLEPYIYNEWKGKKYENINEEYNLFLGLDYIFSDLYKQKREDDIIRLLKELTKSLNCKYIYEDYSEDFEELARLYNLLGLYIEIEYDRVNVKTIMNSSKEIVKEIFSVESWLKNKHKDVYESYNSAISSYTSGYPGACIESCRTTLVSLFTDYKETDGYAKWFRGIYNITGEKDRFSLDDLKNAMDNDLRKKDLAEFFFENKEGKLTKTKTIYMIYSMMSDYGTHRNEATKEEPSLSDALFMIRLTDSILFWVYSITNQM